MECPETRSDKTIKFSSSLNLHPSQKPTGNMAKGKKGKKNAANDDWENDVPTAADELFPVNEQLQNTPGYHKEEASQDAESSAPGPATADDIADDMGGGGLLGAIRKNRANKKKKGGKNKYDDDEDVEAALAKLTMENQDAATEPAKPAPQDSKGKAAAAPAEAEDEEDEDGGRVKSKKEKEREKKEKEKQRKKEQAARKKAAGGAAATPAKAAPAAAPTADEPAEEPAAAPAPEPAGKKKKVPAAIAAIQRQQEARRKAEEEQRKLDEESRKAIAEEEEKIAEEEQKKEEARLRKKEKEKEKKEQLKKEGKYMTEAQKAQQRQNKLRLQQLLDAGLQVEGLADPSAATKKKPVYDKKKKRPGKTGKDADAEASNAQDLAKQKEEEKLAAEKAAREEDERKAVEAAAATEDTGPKDEEDVTESWENAAESDDDVKEAWDMDTDDDLEIKKQKKEEKEKEQLALAEKANNDANGAGKKPGDEADEDKQGAAAAKSKRKEEAEERRRKQHEEALAARSKDNLRSPICCILGHVDTGKTKLLDKIRQTNVQEGEAGGITQQIGATYFPVEAIKQKTDVVNQDGSLEFIIPGLLVIDTPGHESFTNLRSRGSSLCNIAILVVDIMHGLEPQTLESIRLLRDRKTPFIVALNKIDRLYGWKPIPNNGFQDSLSKQSKAVQNEFRDRMNQTKLAFSEQGLNTELFYDNKNMSRYVSFVPTSAHTGEGIPDMLKLLVTLTQQRMAEKLMYLSELECTVLEVKVIEGLGTTIDVVLSNGVLREGDRIVLCGLNGPIATSVRALLTPQPLKELRVKGQYVHHKEVKAALGVKIAANDLENAIAGSRLLVVGPDDDEEDLEDEVMSDLEGLLNKVEKSGKGVCVQASTLGSLEALLDFLNVSKIPVMSISIGPVYKRDVMRAGTMLEKDKKFAVMLCFDVKIDREAQAYADEVGVKLFTADIIYHLFDAFKAYQEQLREEDQRRTADQAVFPCVLRVVQVFHQRDPIVVGIDVIEGSLRVGTPIAIPKPGGENVVLGRVTSIELNHKAVPIAKKTSPSVAVKIEAGNQPILGRHWEEKDTLYSHISRLSINTLKDHFREDVAKEDWALIVQLKKVFKID
ncbi:Eukaryotic translation initiation factor [Drechslerella dactyloides]|uniref:Eukaryotic translation initiation factor 5B n=1 Tax=Drechslerella dactyloides TaxID=74499 RepID=A0AAD6IV82_DREDA|nr:Eukaryotic translation initiation factor [Drechslerella dactyloides]